MLGIALAILYIGWLVFEAHAAVKMANKEDRENREYFERWKNRRKFFDDKNMN